jgi:myo-inositol-1(or 4)-monophosphatase
MMLYWAKKNGETKGTSGYLWVIDPLDGTNNFVKGIPQAGIQITIHKDDAIVYGRRSKPLCSANVCCPERS